MSNAAISALSAAILFAVTVFSTADDTQPPALGPVPPVDIPFDPNTMPSTEKLLKSDLLSSPHWSAKITIRSLPKKDSEPTSLTGTLRKYENSFAARLSVDGTEPAELTLLLNHQQAKAWLDRGGLPEEGSLAPLARCVFLLDVLLDLPQPTEPKLDRPNRYRFTNLGIVRDDDARAYLLAAHRRAKDQTPDRLAHLGSEQIWITIGVDDSIPRKVWTVGDNGSRFELTFLSASTEMDRDPRPHPNDPPDGSQIIDLSNDSVEGDSTERGVMVNPIPFDAASIKRGKLLYIADCEVCHSVDGTGRDSDVTDNAADLTNTEFWLSDGSETATFLAIRDGAGDEMPGYKDDYGDDKMIWDLVNYIRSLQK